MAVECQKEMGAAGHCFRYLAFEQRSDLVLHTFRFPEEALFYA